MNDLGSRIDAASLTGGDPPPWSQADPFLMLCRKCFTSPSDVTSEGISICVAHDGRTASVYYLKNPWLLCIEQRVSLPERKSSMPSKITIHGSVVNVIENNNAPIYIDARAVDVDASVSNGTSCTPAEIPNFECSPDYTRVSLRGKAFRFGALQASIIRILHGASTTSSPWVSERHLLAQTGSRSEALRHVFRNHDRDALFEMDPLGRVRLRL
jgi:hypothetical protein